MNVTRNKRRPRETRPACENLDSRIAPTAMGMAALAASVRVEQRQVGRWESSLATATPGSHRFTSLTNHIANTEARIAVQEARLSRMETANPITTAPVRRPGNPIPPVSPIPIIVTHPDPMPAGLQPRPGNPKPIIVHPPVTFNAITPPTTPPPVTPPTGTGSNPSQPSLPANVSATLDVIYDAFQQDPSNFASSIPATGGANHVVIQGSNVGIQVRDSNPADFNTLMSELQSAGMQITASSAQAGLVVGLLPVAQLPTVAGLSDAPSVTPLFQPTLN